MQTTLIELVSAARQCWVAAQKISDAVLAGPTADLSRTEHRARLVELLDCKRRADADFEHRLEAVMQLVEQD